MHHFLYKLGRKKNHFFTSLTFHYSLEWQNSPRSNFGGTLHVRLPLSTHSCGWPSKYIGRVRNNVILCVIFAFLFPISESQKEVRLKQMVSSRLWDKSVNGWLTTNSKWIEFGLTALALTFAMFPTTNPNHSSTYVKAQWCGTPLYGLYGTCSWTGYGFWPLYPEQGI